MMQLLARVRAGDRDRDRDRGAAAVELALVLPLLLFIVFATIDFGRMIEAQVTLTHAAREGVRVWALGNGKSSGPTAGDVQTAVDESANPLTGVTASAASCTTSQETTVSVSYTFHFVTPVGALASLLPGTPVSGSDVVMTAQGAMQCER
jgi:Flp pilus assembly protein TadG